MRIHTYHVTLMLGAAAAAVAIAGAPGASAAPGGGPVCSDSGRSTNCITRANQQVYTSPKPLPRVFPPSINPRWRAIGYSPRFPKYGFDPKWQAFGYNPRYSGFQRAR